MRATRFGGIVLMACCWSPALDAQAPARGKSAVVATVDRREITEANVQVQLLLQREAAKPSATRESAIEELIDRQLIRNFLAHKGIRIPDDLVDLQWIRLQEAAARQNVDLARELGRIGYPEAELRQDLIVPLAWTAYVKKQTTPEKVRERFEKDRKQFDGTTRRVRHLVLTVAADGDAAAWTAAEEKATELRTAIASGQTTFADAAREHSNSPSREQGGELGFVHYRGDLPDPVAAAAFDTDLNQVSQPVRSPYGVHLIVAEEERPGDLSPEDARADVLETIARELWKTTATELRKKAKIVKKS